MSDERLPGERKRLRDLSMNVLVLVLGLVVGLVLVELASRIFVPTYLLKPHPKGLYTNDPDLGYVLSRNFAARLQHRDYDVAVQTNSDGLRGEEIGQKRPDVFRILVLGDSIAWGYGVEFEESFPRRLEAILNENLDAQFEVINAAVPGYGTDQELLLLKRQGLSYDPDLIVVGLFVENDVYDNLIEGAKYRTVKNGYLVDWYRFQRNKTENPLVVVTAFLSKHSHFYVLLRSGFRALESYAGSESASFRLEAFPGLSRQKYLPVFAKEYSPEIERGIVLTEHLLMDMRDEAKAYDAGVLVVLFPSKVQVYPDLWDEVRRVYGLDEGDYVLTKPNEILAGFCDRESLPCLDLLPAFRAAGTNAALYLPTDLHQSATGQALAAQQVYEALLARGLVPR